MENNWSQRRVSKKKADFLCVVARSNETHWPGGTSEGWKSLAVECTNGDGMGG